MRHNSRSLQAPPGVPHYPSPFPTILNRLLSSTPIPGHPPLSIPLPYPNMSHPLEPTVQPKDGHPAFRAPRTNVATKWGLDQKSDRRAETQFFELGGYKIELLLTKMLNNDI